MFNSNKSLTGHLVSWALSLSGHSVSLGTQSPLALSLPRHSVSQALSLLGTQSPGTQSPDTWAPGTQSPGYSVSRVLGRHTLHDRAEIEQYSENNY